MAREKGLKLVVLWFGTWKNGNSHYVPAWIKRDKRRFLWAKTADGTAIRSLSPVCTETKEADKRAFTTLCRHISEVDAEQTVIGVQVENEPGLIGSPRDYSPEATALFTGPVPEEIEKFSKKSGTWEAVFGIDAAEFFSAYHIAKYIDEIAESGKRYLNRVMYVNVWLGEMYAHIPGTSYPSGGAVTRTFSLWKALTPHIDAVSPDIYLNDYKTVDDLYKTYYSENNIFYIPESMPTPLGLTNAMRAVAEYNLTGIHVFGVDMLAALFAPGAASPDPNSDFGAIASMGNEVAGAFAILKNAKPLIEKYQGTGKLYAVGQYEDQASQYIDFGDYIGYIRFLNPKGIIFGRGGEENMDARHYKMMYPDYRAKGFIVYAGKGEFYLVGDAYRLMLYPKRDIVELTSAIHSGEFLSERSQAYISVTEGIFTDAGYTPTIIRNGDEYDYGLWVTNDIGVLKAQLDWQECD
ncbi:MAG: DUF5597 domain-containing protein [Lachnospiraceae bacterium]|nr:DUF5597 domain-containing protein [Lachnospiraceae bacterium]